MPWRQLFRIFTNNPQLIQRLSETGPIRAAARKSVYWFNEAKYKGQDAFEKLKSENTNSGRKGFLARFKQELQAEIKKVEELKKQNKAPNTERDTLNEFTKGLKKGWDNHQKRRGRF